MNKQIRSLSLITATLGTLLSACSHEDKSKAYETGDPVIHNMDTTVKPGDDFEEYGNGGWRKRTEIPPDRASTGIGFEVLQRAGSCHPSRSPWRDTSRHPFTGSRSKFLDARDDRQATNA